MFCTLLTRAATILRLLGKETIQFNTRGKKSEPGIMSTPLGGGHIIFAFSAVRRPTWFPDILGNSSYPIFTKFGMQVYWVNSLYGIAFGDDSSIAN